MFIITLCPVKINTDFKKIAIKIAVLQEMRERERKSS